MVLRRDLLATLAILIIAAEEMSCSVHNESVQEGDIPAVRVITNKLSYRRGEPIIVTIRNGLHTVIYASRGGAYCSLVSVQRLEAGEWEAGSPTAASCPEISISIAPRSVMRGALGPTLKNSGAQRPIVSEASTPSLFQKDLRTLPTVEPWKPGDPIREVPKAGIPPGAESIPFSALQSEISPGTYRINFSFKLGSMSGPAQKVYSEEFVVTD